MDGRVVFENAVVKMGDAVLELLAANELSKDTIDLFLSHQANLRIIEEIIQKLGLPPEKVPHNIARYGNTSSASIPILYDELARAGRIKTGQKIVMMSFGSGFCWGAGLLLT
jgi:3-oxoacyl-[acyl-carrier-protein] synthase-3